METRNKKENNESLKYMLWRIKFSLLVESLPGNKEKSAKYHIMLKKSQIFGKIYIFLFLVNTLEI